MYKDSEARVGRSPHALAPYADLTTGAIAERGLDAEDERALPYCAAR
jgi:hypothetical protein